jgi:hypothetical protein
MDPVHHIKQFNVIFFIHIPARAERREDYIDRFIDRLQVELRTLTNEDVVNKLKKN